MDMKPPMLRVIGIVLCLLSFTVTRANADKFFNRSPRASLNTAISKAQKDDIPIFMVIYDNSNENKSNIKSGLGYFMKYETTKTLVEDNFIVLLVKSTAKDVAQYIPKDNPLENSLIVILSPDGKVIKWEETYGNPGEGLVRVKRYIKAWEEFKNQRSTSQNIEEILPPEIRKINDAREIKITEINRQYKIALLKQKNVYVKHRDLKSAKLIDAILLKLSNDEIEKN